MAPNEFSDDTDRHRCPNCGRIHATSALVEIKHIFQRVAPGEPMPSGECPDCGALCQVIRKPAAPREERLMRRPRSRPTAGKVPRSSSNPEFVLSDMELIRLLRQGAKPLVALRLHDGVVLTRAAEAVAEGRTLTTNDLVRLLRRGETALINAGWRRQASRLGMAADQLAAAARPTDVAIAAMLREVAHRDVDPATPDGPRRIAKLLDAADALAPAEAAADTSCPVRAEVHTDDHRMEVDFDASPWFVQATNEDIAALAKIDWGGDYAADAVALFMEARHTGVEDLFAYLAKRPTMGKDDPVGFECHVNADDARQWLATHRPELSKGIPE